MKWLMLTLFFFSARAYGQAAPFRGYYMVEQTLSERMLPAGERLHLDQYTSDQGLLFLLGFWDNQLSPRGFRNGQANALNMLIWYMTLSALADDLAADCRAPRRLNLNPAFAATLDSVCTAPLDENLLQSFWVALMGYDAPQEEFEAWRDFILASGAAPTIDRVRAMSLAIFLNPYFLVND